MEPLTQNIELISALILGMTLGLRHALDPDHIVAVSTVVTEHKNPLRAFWIGLSWGLGHTTTLFLLGITVLVLRLTIPDRLVLAFEVATGVMLVFLGVQVAWRLRVRKVHGHQHMHQKVEHKHLHAHSDNQDHKLHHYLAGFGRPFLRPKSYIIGCIHGVAGTAGLILLVLASLKSVWAGIVYILFFGIGSMLTMGLVTVVMSIPMSASGRFPNLNRSVYFIAALASVVFGGFLIYEGWADDGLLSGR
jgi:high-affinity nickel permease